MKLVKTILICLISSQLWGTAQIPDFLIYQGDTLSIYTNPLEIYFNKKANRTIGEIEMVGGCTALWRGYAATWLLEKDSLFLIRIQTDYCSRHPIEVDLAKEFGKKKVFASWVSYEIINPHGKLLKYVHQGYQSYFEKERGFVFNHGRLEKINHYDNSSSRTSKFQSEPTLLYQFLYENLNWSLIESANQEQKQRVIAQFIPDALGHLTQVKILRGVNTEIDQEVKRVIHLIPNWEIYFRRGKAVESKWTLPIFLDKNFYLKKITKE